MINKWGDRKDYDAMLRVVDNDNTRQTLKVQSDTSVESGVDEQTLEQEAILTHVGEKG